jgi:hypothetical protein
VVERFFRDVLGATQEVWVNCKHCSKRSQVAVPSWGARTRGLELLLDQGWGRPEPAPLDEGERFQAAIDRAFEQMSDEKLAEISELEDWQREFLARPLQEQMAICELSKEEARAIKRKRPFPYPVMH